MTNRPVQPSQSTPACPYCPTPTKVGVHSKAQKRFKCHQCGKTFTQEFPRLLESCATRHHEGAEEEKRRSARHFPCCVLEEIFGRDEPFSA